ncbi:MAG: aldo/keto reductase [Erysipelotrichaceae bacterium]|nr:aldo/keto reductase [Erysipelotrichaceae bacterium]
MSEYLGKDIFKLGFGLMRLPKLEDGSIDLEQTKVMVDKFIEAGGVYFDTAYVYDNGESEKAFKTCVADRYPRERYFVATKLNAAMQATDEESAKAQFFTSLERTGAGYFDFYLLHAISRNNIEKYDRYGIWDFVKQQKEKGLIRHMGFSFHDNPEMLDELLSKHPDVDFIQLQINYADMENPNVQSRGCYEVARKHNVPLTVMEPIKGGKLADPIPEVKKVFDEADPNASYASWAIRYVASLDGIITVLSGMSNIAQMEDNLSYMKNFKPLDEKEQKVIEEVQRILRDDVQIKCTACHYCTEGCPMSIPIPDIFSIYNKGVITATEDKRLRSEYERITDGKGKASDCIECGQCEGVCPQHLPIIDLLKKCRSMEE